MRKLLLAGVALGAVAAYGPVSPARADDAVFPVTTETTLAGLNGPSLNGAAPGSVQVNLGGRLFSSIWFMNNPSGTPSWAKAEIPQLGNWLFLFPGFDYASPGGWHFGVQAELRATNATQGVGSPSQPWWHQAWGYVSSASFGKFQFGAPPSALTSTAVGTPDDFGTGVFFGWFSSNPYIPWVMGDAEDNYTFQQKLLYTTPNFGGFKLAVSYEPTAVGLNYCDCLTQGSPPNSGLLNSRQRVEVAGQYKGTFGPIGFAASAGYVWADAANNGDVAVGQNVSFGNFGLQFTFAGFELEGGATIGKYNYAIVDDGNPMGPLPIGASNTNAGAAGFGYAAGPIKVGAVYYHVGYDQMDFQPVGTGVSHPGVLNGYGFGAAYTVGPGVVLYADGWIAWAQGLPVNNGQEIPTKRQQPTGIGIGTFFTW